MMFGFSWFDWFLVGINDLFDFLGEASKITIVICIILFTFFLVLSIGALVAALKTQERKNNEITLKQIEKRVEKKGFDFGDGGEECE